MSNHLAIATITAGLMQLIQEAIDGDGLGGTVSVGRPVAQGDQDAAPSVNLFLYQVAPNAAQRNSHLAARGADGRQRGPSVVAFDLFYLLSFYGKADGFAAERLLGSVARALEHRPTIGKALSKRMASDHDVLADSDLDRAPEPPRATPVALSLDDMSKLWSVLFQVPYVLSAAYRLSPIVIETRETGSPGPPVTRIGATAALLEGPRLSRIGAEGGPGWPIVWGSNLLLEGSGLDRADMTLRLGGVEASLAGLARAGGRLALPLESARLGGATLPAGMTSVELILPPPQGAPAHLTCVSDAGAFLLRPTVALAANGLQTTPVDAGDPAGLKKGSIRVALSPPLREGQTIRLLLDGLSPERPSHQLAPAPPAAFPAAEAAFPFEAAQPGVYLMQALVDGAASAPVIETDPQSPDYRQILGPKVTIP
jgi:hypothetical protein